MLEKLGIRIAASLVVLWCIVQTMQVKVAMDAYIYMMLLLLACFTAVIIEFGYEILRKRIQYMPLYLCIMIALIIITYVFLGYGIYILTMIYVFISISVQLYREYNLTKLLKVSLNK